MWEFRHMVRQQDFSLEEALPFFTCNVADGLGLSQKGTIAPGGDGDVLLLTEDLMLDTVIARGSIMMAAGKVLRKGTYE